MFLDEAQYGTASFVVTERPDRDDGGYHFVIPSSLFGRMRSAAAQARRVAARSPQSAAIIVDCTAPDSCAKIFAVAPCYIDNVAEFFNLKALHTWHQSDINWLARDKGSYPNLFDVFQFFLHRSEPCYNGVRGIVAYERAHLKRRFQAVSSFRVNNPHQFQASFEEIVGRLAGDTFLSDVAVVFVLHKVCMGVESCYVFDPIYMARRAAYTLSQHSRPSQRCSRRSTLRMSIG
ncbi:hypothetical protein PybrP1_005672 [[Pythium] brassicae (nom. inval.)]|nr:hypothetical protein PybrP1_005672 [[Pythium] brassicae (nom. inval.)]